MKNKRHIALITAVSLILTLVFSFPVFADISPYEKPEAGTESEEYVPGEAIICICPEVSDEKRIAAASAGLFGIAPEIESDFLMDVSNAAKSIEEENGQSAGISSVFSNRAVLKLVKSDTFSTEELIKLYSGKPGVLFAEPNYIIKPEYTKDNDPIQENKLLRSSPEDSKTPDLTTLTQYEFGDGPGGINVQGWNDPANKNAEGVVVAVLDSGVDYENEDLKNVMWDEGEKIQALKDLGGGKYGINTGYDYYVGEEGKTEKDDPMDYIGHGTHCAGIIAAEWNGLGVSGAANGAKIMAVKAFIEELQLTTSATCIKGFHYIRTAKDNGVNVAAVNCSLGGPVYEFSSVYAVRELCEDDIVFCFASGNENSDIDILVDNSGECLYLPQVINVDSSNRNGGKSGFSNYGKRGTHLFAPGSHIMSTTLNAKKIVCPVKEFSGPVKDVSGNEVYDSFDSADHTKELFNYEPAVDEGIKIVDGELKISGKFPKVNTAGLILKPVFTIKTSLPDPPDGKTYYLVYRKRISDEGHWFFPVTVKPKNGGSEKLLSYDLISADGNYSYDILPIDGDRYDLRNLELIFNLYNKSDPGSEEPIKDASIDEIWITDANGYPYIYDNGTSMAAPAVTGEVAILAAAFPKDSASKRAARVLASAEQDEDLRDKCITGGKANVANALDEKYTPVISCVKAEGNGLHIKGFFFGAKDHIDVSISQGDNTWSVSGKSLELLEVNGSEDDAGDILLKIPQGLKNKEMKVTVTDKGKINDRQSYERVLSPEDPDELLEKGDFYERIPISKADVGIVSLEYLFGSFTLNGSMYFQFTDGAQKAETIRFRDGQWNKPEEEIDTTGGVMAWNGMLVYPELSDTATLVFHDGNRVVERKTFIPEKTDTEVPDELKEWVFNSPDEFDVEIDLYYDGKNAILVRSREDATVLYRLDPESGKGTFLGVLENYYFNMTIAHEEKTGSPNTYYFLGRGHDAEGNFKDFVAEKVTLDPYLTEDISDIKPDDYTIDGDYEYWSGCGVKNGIYLVGGRTVKDNGGIPEITADNYFFDYSRPEEGFRPCERWINDTAVFPVEAVAAYGRVYFLGCSNNGPILCYTEADTLPHYGDSKPEPEKKIDYSDPASPLHLTDGSDVEKLSTDNARYVVTLSSNTAVIGGTKADISSFFEAAPGFDSSAKHRYKSSVKKTAKVNKKGILTAKKKGETEITCEQKVKGGTWEPLGEKMHLFVQLPEMVKKQDVSADTAGLSAYSFLSKTTYSPTMWRSTNTKVATVDENGNITILKPGRTNIIAEYGEGKTGSKKKFKTKLKVG